MTRYSRHDVLPDLDLAADFPENSRDEWMEVVNAQLGGKAFESLVTKTYEGIPIQPMYFQDDLEGLPHVQGMPGLPPFLRGTSELGPVVEGWTVAQEILYPDPAQVNRALRWDLERGLGAVHLPLDRAACGGVTPVEARDEDVGQGGLSLCAAVDFSRALEGVELERVPILLQPGASGLAAAAMLVASHESRGGRVRALTGSVGADPLGELCRFGTLPAPLDRLWLEAAQLTAWARDFAPKLGTLGVSGHPFHEAGGSAVQELAFTIALAVDTLRALGGLGLGVNEVAPRLMASFSLGSDFFMEIAKLRAARLLWVKVVEAFGGADEAGKLRIHGRTSRWNKTSTDPWVNMLRVTTEAFSGICGGCDSIAVAPFDEVLGLPTDFSRRVARNVQILLREEAHMGRVLDPAGGSYYVEVLTGELASRAWALFQEVERQGGFVPSFLSGWIHGNLAEVAAQRARNIATRKNVFVGTNSYPNLAEREVTTHSLDRESFLAERRRAVTELRQEVKSGRRQAALAHLAALADRPGAMEAAIGAARAGATLRGITCALRGESPAPLVSTPLAVHRGAEPFEALRRDTRAFVLREGAAPKVFLANLGPIPKHKARAEFSRSFFELAAFDVLGNDGFSTVEEAAEAAVSSGARVVCLCSTDADYPDLVPPLVGLLKAADPEVTVILAGYPKEHLEAFRAAGVDDFIHLRSNAVEQLQGLQRKLGVVR